MRIFSLKVSNYKTLCDLSIEFGSHFTAICGANDSGKSNIVKAIRALLENEDVYSSSYFEVSVKDDFPLWSQAPSDCREIRIESDLLIDQDLDIAIHQVVCKQLSLENPAHELRLKIILLYSSKGLSVTASCGGKESEGLEAEQILKALRATGPLFYHNSTSNEHGYRRRKDFYGLLSEVSPEYMSLQDEVQSYVDKRLNKIIKTHQKEISRSSGTPRREIRCRNCSAEIQFRLPSFRDNTWRERYCCAA